MLGVSCELYFTLAVEPTLEFDENKISVIYFGYLLLRKLTTHYSHLPCMRYALFLFWSNWRQWLVEHGWQLGPGSCQAEESITVIYHASRSNQSKQEGFCHETGKFSSLRKREDSNFGIKNKIRGFKKYGRWRHGSAVLTLPTSFHAVLHLSFHLFSWCRSTWGNQTQRKLCLLPFHSGLKNWPSWLQSC